MIIVPIHNLPSEGMQVNGSEPAAFLDIAKTPALSCDKPIEYELRVQRVHSDILVTGTITTEVTGICGRCLEPCTQHVTNSDVCQFYGKVTEPELDLTANVREDILLVFPVNLICNNDCKGLCQTCGCNLNHEQCNCKSSGDEGNIWSELDKLGY